MAKITWDNPGERYYETGVDHGVLYLLDSEGAYSTGVAWNGLTQVSEKPTGAEPKALYADNIKYLNLMSTEEFEATIEAYTYPDEFGVCDGSAEVVSGLYVGQQPRKTFGLCYRTLVGNDVDGTELGYKLHIIYGCLASPSEKAYETVNDDPDAIQFSWDIKTTPVAVEGYKPTATIVIDSRKVNEDALGDLEDALYGTQSTSANLPLPDKIVEFFENES